jgi:hypothetical protein
MMNDFFFKLFIFLSIALGCLGIGTLYYYLFVRGDSI